jgi:hypothetical protein
VELTWLIDLFRRFSRPEVEDLVATYLLTVGFNPKSTPPVLLGAIDALAQRAGVEAGEERATSQKKIQQYLADHPLQQELKLAFEQKLRESYAGKETGALEQAFARFAAEDLAKRAPDRKRVEGTRPGYLALLAHEDVD